MKERSPLPAVPLWAYGAIALTAVLCSISIFKRFQMESRNKATTVVAEYEAIEALAGSEGISMDRALRELKAKGLGGVVLTEETVGDLISAGKVSVSSGTLTAIDAASEQRLIRGLGIRFGKVGKRPLRDSAMGLPSQPQNYSFETVPRVTVAIERATTVGIDPIQADTARKLGLTIVARCGNPPGITPRGIEQTLDWANELGATVFLPVGDQVLGRRDALKTTVESLRKLSMLYATPEFSKIGGDSNVIEDAPDLTVRLHSAQEAELDKLPVGEAVDRFARAARERNMRLLLVRPLSYGAESPVSAFGDFVRSICKEIRSQGGAIGRAKPFQDPGVSRILFVLIGLSLVPVFYYVAGATIRNPSAVRGLTMLVALAGPACYSDGTKQIVALFGSMLFPIVAFLLLDRRRGTSVAIEFVAVTLTSLVGGLVVAGLLNGVEYTIAAKVFPGVKLSVFLPIALVGLYFFATLTHAAEKLREPATWRAIGIGLGFLAALGLMWARTGNDNPAAVSSWELKVRDVLDVLLFVRPRTKAFLIGFPLLAIGIAMLIRCRSTHSNAAKSGAWTALALMGGAIGATDVVNTLCHLHTPILLSLQRILLESVLGCILGLVVWGLMGRKRPAEQ